MCLFLLSVFVGKGLTLLFPLLLRLVNIKILSRHVDLFYVGVNSIRFYMLWYWSINTNLFFSHFIRQLFRRNWTFVSKSVPISFLSLMIKKNPKNCLNDELSNQKFASHNFWEKKAGIIAERSRASTFVVFSKPFRVDGPGFESRQGMANEISTVLFVFIRD